MEMELQQNKPVEQTIPEQELNVQQTAQEPTIQPEIPQQPTQKGDINIPADIPVEVQDTYKQNFLKITRNTGKFYLFAGDQKVEHLNDDFYGETKQGPIPIDDADPEHLFKIAANSHVGCFAAQYGLITKYANTYTNIPYLIKLNSKTHLVKTEQKDPVSRQLVSIKQVMQLKSASHLDIVGVGYTIYLGSEYEHEMLAEAARIVADAHQQGLLVVFWIYPRGKAVLNEKDPHLIAGATGVACSLGADFVKVSYPKKEGALSEEIFKEAVQAAGRTKVITSGGSSMDVRAFLERLHKQIHVSGASGNATGRNVHQKSLPEAIRMSNAIAAITYGNKDPEFAMKVFNGEIEVQ